MALSDRILRMSAICALWSLVGCGGTHLEEESPTSEGLQPQEAQEDGNSSTLILEQPGPAATVEAQGEVGAQACGRNYLSGRGSCRDYCWRNSSQDYRCGSGLVFYGCNVFNYEHWINYSGDPGVYLRTQGPFYYEYCANTNPRNCSGFCN